jgi:ubiquitin-protein ligase
MNEENIADVHAEVDGPGASVSCSRFSETNKNVPLSSVRLTKTYTLLVAAVDTPFFGGVFKMQLVLPSDYPHTPPKGTCSCIFTSAQSWSS